MFTSLFSVLSAILLAFSSLVSAAPAQPNANGPDEFIAYGPPIILPTNSTVWIIGTTQLVTWKTDSVPSQAKGYNVSVLLGYMANNSENLDLQHPLASNISIMQGEASVKVPSVNPNHNYIVVVLGTSGDASPQFTIQQ